MTEISEKEIEAFARYRRKQIAELRPYIEGEDVSHVSISPEDVKAGSPKRGDMIARNPKNHNDQWLVARAYFLDNFEPLTAAEQAEPAPAARSGEVKVNPHTGEVSAMHELPRDLVTILRTEAKNQRTPPIDYVIAEDGGRMVHRPEPDIAMAELLEEAADKLEKLAATLAEKDKEIAALRKKANDWSMEADKYKRALDRCQARNAGGKDADRQAG